MVEKTRIRKLSAGKPEVSREGKGVKEMANAGRSDESDVNLDAMSDEELMGLISAALDRLAPVRFSEVIDTVYAKRRAKEDEVKETLLTEFRERAAQMGMSFDTLFTAGRGRTRRSDAGQPLAPRYKGPSGQTWSGRGRQPRWLTELEATGHRREEFLIREEAG